MGIFWLHGPKDLKKLTNATREKKTMAKILVKGKSIKEACMGWLK